jgi:hypothetical protein
MSGDIPLVIEQRERMEQRTPLDVAVELVEKRCKAAEVELTGRFHEDMVGYTRSFYQHYALKGVLHELQQLQARYRSR